MALLSDLINVLFNPFDGREPEDHLARAVLLGETPVRCGNSTSRSNESSGGSGPFGYSGPNKDLGNPFGYGK